MKKSTCELFSREVWRGQLVTPALPQSHKLLTMIRNKLLRCEEYVGFFGEERGVLIGFTGEVAKG